MPTVQQIQYPNTTGYRFSHGSLRIMRGSDEAFGYKQIEYKPAVEEEQVRLHGRFPLGRTKGNVSFEGSATMGIEEFYNLVAALGDGYLDKIENYAVIRTEGEVTVTDELIGVRILDHTMASENGAAQQNVAITFSIIDMKINGARPAV